MKYFRYIIIILVILITLSCKKTNLTITEPGPDFFLGKMQNGNWKDVEVNGNKLTISSGDHQGNYTFEEPILGVGGVYNDGKGGYLVTVPAGDNLGVVHMDKVAKETVDEILSIVGNGNALGALNAIINSDDPNNIDAGKITGNANITQEEKKRVEELIKKLNDGGNHFQNPGTIGPKS